MPAAAVVATQPPNGRRARLWRCRRSASTVGTPTKKRTRRLVHELAITQSLVDAVCEHTDGAPIVAVNVRVGRLSGVVPDAMRFCFELITEGTPLQGARLEIEEPAGRARCRTCRDEFALPDLILLCPCGSADVDVLSGRELAVSSVEVGERV